ncbi:MAG: hypothetical protein PHI98_15870, partial [Eubacteriales bacterium]|nr:hypothetical protein [Eubacteriales bacterium]
LEGWGGNGGGSGAEELPMTDDYGTMSYRLPNAPMQLNGLKKLDTGIKLFETVDAAWTVVCVFDGEISCAQGYPYSVLTCMLDAGKGLTVRRSSADEGLTVLAGSGGIRCDLAGATEVLNGRNVMIITKSGDNYGIYLNGVLAYGAQLGYGIVQTDTHSCTLIAGARQNGEGAYEYYTAFTLDELRVYTTALDEAAITALSDELA